jgi:hypothetical protein
MTRIHEPLSAMSSVRRLFEAIAVQKNVRDVAGIGARPV